MQHDPVLREIRAYPTCAFYLPSPLCVHLHIHLLAVLREICAYQEQKNELVQCPEFFQSIHPSRYALLRYRRINHRKAKVSTDSTSSARSKRSRTPYTGRGICSSSSETTMNSQFLANTKQQFLVNTKQGWYISASCGWSSTWLHAMFPANLYHKASHPWRPWWLGIV